METKKAINIIPASNHILVEISKKDFIKDFGKKERKLKILETKEHYVYFNDMEYIYCKK